MFQCLKNIYWRIQKPVLETILSIQNDHDEYLKTRMEVMLSPLWDENYYFINYRTDINNSHLLPIDHFLQYGWKCGYNPGPYFNLLEYQTRYNIQINPLVHYLTYGRFHYLVGFSQNPYEISNEVIEQYWQHQQKRETSKVVYTCITNNYDSLYQIRSHYYVNPEWDYVCFSDDNTLIQQKQLGIWQIRPLIFDKLDNVRNNRYHKICPHIVLPQYEESVYLDANINILTSYLFDLIKKRNSDFLIPIHITTDNLYKEAQWVEQMGFDTDKLIKQLEHYRNDGFPEDYPLPENNLIYRKHNTPIIQTIMDQWWEWVCDYCQRDQCSLSYVLWKNHIDISKKFIINTRLDNKNFCVFSHQKGYSLNKS